MKQPHQLGSDYTPRADGAGVRRLRNAALRREALEGHHFCRLAEYPLFLVVSDAFKHAFEAAGCTGYGFEALTTD